MSSAVCLCVLSFALVADPDAADLVRKYEEALSRIHTMRARLTIKLSQDGGKSWVTMSEIDIVRSGRRELMTLHSNNSYSLGKIFEGPSSYRSLTNEGGRRVLHSVDPNDLPHEPVDYGQMEVEGRRVSGGIDPPQPPGPFGYRGQWPAIALIAPDWEFSLSEMWEASGRPRAMRKSDRKGETVYELNVAPRDKSRSYVLAISPDRGNVLASSRRLDQKGKPIDYFGDLRVEEFQEPKPGLFLPKLIRGDSGEKPDPKQLYEVVVGDVVVNEPIDANQFTLRFPEGIGVVDATKDNLIYVWGDGKPRLIFKTPKEFSDWVRTQITAARKRGRPAWWRSNWAIVTGATVSLVTILALRWWIKRSR